jgi:hypothetical protein
LREPDTRAQWFLEPVIERRRAAGVILEAGQCYGYRMLPILGGNYDGENREAMSAAGHLGFTGYMHEKIKNLPDGTQIKINFTD